MSDDEPIRCGWATARSGPDFELYRDYHDREWGQTVRDGVALFERMSLEAFQSGLSWLVILRKRENFRKAFKRFDVDKVARFTERDVQRLLADEGIVRNRAKIEATIANARAATPTESAPTASKAWRRAARSTRLTSDPSASTSPDAPLNVTAPMVPVMSSG